MSKIATEQLFAAATAVAGTGGSAQSAVIDLSESDLNENLGMLILVSTGTADLDFTMKASTDGTNFYTPNNGSGSMATIKEGVTGDYWYEFTPPVAPFIQVTAAGSSANDANVTIQGTIVKKVL